MAAQKGKNLLLKLDDGQGGFDTVAGLRSKSLAFNTRSVDITNADSTGEWQELLAGAGIKSAAISGSGIFKDQPADDLVRTTFFNGVILNWQIIVPDFGMIDGLFQITQLSYQGEHDGEVSFEMSLESAGTLNFSAI